MSNFENTICPNFSLPDQDGNLHTLSDYKGKLLLLYFYPKDDTPGCTIEACNFRDALNDLKQYNIQVLGISADNATSHKKFAEKFHLNFPLLADVDKQLINHFNLWVEKSMYGKKYFGIQRDSFLIDPDGIILKHYVKVNPEEHIQETLKDARVLKP